MYAPGAFVLALGALQGRGRGSRSAFRTGAGIGWHEHDESVFVGCEQFFRPGYIANLVPAWIPALDGVDGKLRAGARSPTSAAGSAPRRSCWPQHYPNSPIRRLRLPRGLDRAGPQAGRRRRGRRPGRVRGRRRADASPASGYDLVTTFDCLHDMGDPLGRGQARPRRPSQPDGTWLIVEPFAADEHRRGNLNPVGRVYYSFSTLLCVPNAMSQPGGYALGAQAGEAAIRQVVTDAGFTRFRRAAETPFNLVYEVRP